jgi:DNA-directed RNA polymerase subunit RPC12/RpoP
MTYKMTVRGAPPALIFRKYRCTDCEYLFQVTHTSRDEPVPACPLCASREKLQTAPVALMPASPALRTAGLHAAVNMAQEMMEEQGYTDMNDYARPGDIAVKGPAPLQTSEREATLREVAELAGPEAAAALEPSLQAQVKNFWNTPGAAGAGISTGGGSPEVASVLAGVKSKPVRHIIEGSAALDKTGT